ncbi:MAG: hypothetical protein AAF934_09350 [Bacteroidota bacterium]
MKDQKRDPETAGDVRTTFTFDPSNLSISDLYVTQIFRNNGYESARIFANGVMQARLLLKYSYEFNTAEFPTENEDQIMETIKAAAEPYLQATDYLKIYETAHPQLDITANGWGKAFEGNEYLFDLDNASSKATLGQDIQNIKVLTETNATVNMVFDIYVTPPFGLTLNYKLIAQYSYTDDKEHMQYSNEVSINAEEFKPTKDDLELKYVASADDTFPDFSSYGYNNGILFALAYKGEKYGSARLNNITQYLGWVLDPNETNICITHCGLLNGLAGIFYYPSARNRNQLSAGEPGKTYNGTTLTMNTAYETIDDMQCTGEGFKWIQSFTEAQARVAHDKGIPVVITFKRESSPMNRRFLDYKQRSYPFKMKDNCGNTIDVWFYHYAFDEKDENGECCYTQTIRGSHEDGVQYSSCDDSPVDGNFYSKWAANQDQGRDLIKIRRAGPCLP